MATAFHLTYAAVLLAVFAEQLGLPFPSAVFLMTAGAVSAHGEMRTGIIVSLGVAGCLVADGIWFSLGRRWGSPVLRLLCRFASDPRISRQNADEKFRRYGAAVLCVAKFVPGLNFVMPPLVGAEGVSFAAFIALDVSGCFLWAAFYAGLGYIFSSEVDVVIRCVRNLGAIFGIVILTPLCLYAGFRGVALLRMIHRLRLRRIGPAMLARKMKSKSKIAVLDLLDFEGESNSEKQEAIPGALRVDPTLLRKSPHLSVPDDVDIILYSSSAGDTVPARVAVALQRIGIKNVWVLEGGLKAWRAQGFPVAQSPELPEVAAARVGVKLPPVLTRSRGIGPPATHSSSS